MAFWLRSEERRVANRARRVHADLSAVGASRRAFAARLRHELAKPKMLLACFAAGLGFGWLRRADARSGLVRGDAGRGEERERAGGRIAKAAAAVLAGLRIYEQVRRTAAFVDGRERYAGRKEPAAATGPAVSVASGDYSPDPMQEHEAHDRD